MNEGANPSLATSYYINIKIQLSTNNMAIIKQQIVSNGVIIDSYQAKNLDDYTLQFRAKHNCRKCHGRGQLLFDNPSKGLKWTETCSCVHRRER